MIVLVVILMILVCIAISISIYLIILKSKNMKVFKLKQPYSSNIFKPSLTKSKILVLQDGAYKVFPEYGKIGSEINKSYCDKWGYDYKLVTYDDLGIVPPYWLKIKDVKELLPKYDAVLYVDMDAIFTDFDTSIDTIVEYIDTGKSYDLYIGVDPSYLSVNTGVFLVRNTYTGNLIMESLLATCLNDKGKLVNKCAQWEYNKDTQKWSCPDCLFGGYEYEQGIMDYMSKLYPDNVLILDTPFFSNQNTDKQSFILHLMGSLNKDKVVNVFKEVKDRLKL